MKKKAKRPTANIPTFMAASQTPPPYTTTGKNTWGSTTTSSGYIPYPYGDFCDCENRCPKCGKRKRPQTYGPVWCC